MLLKKSNCGIIIKKVVIKMNLEDLQRLRKRAYSFMMWGLLLFLVAVFLVFAFGAGDVPVLVYIAMVFVFAGIGLMGYGFYENKSIEKKFKNYFMKKILDEELPGSVYHESMGISLNEIYSGQLLKKADRSRTEDLIEGVVNNVSYKTCDLRLEERVVHTTGNGHRTVTYVPYFIGRYFIFDFNKEVNGDVFVTESSVPGYCSNLKKVSMESFEFNKTFKVFATDELSAFYVLTPQMMATLIDFEKRNPGCLMFHMTTNKLHVAINNKIDTFSINFTQRIDKRLVNQFRRQFGLISEIVEGLKLDNTIFKEASEAEEQLEAVTEELQEDVASVAVAAGVVNELAEQQEQAEEEAEVLEEKVSEETEVLEEKVSEEVETLEEKVNEEARALEEKVNEETEALEEK